VWCPTKPGTISVSPGTKICSNNNYPVNVTLTVTNYVGNISGWTVNNSSIPNSAGQLQFLCSSAEWYLPTTIGMHQCSSRRPYQCTNNKQQ
jgi:hypothetical protein